MDKRSLTTNGGVLLLIAMVMAGYFVKPGIIEHMALAIDDGKYSVRSDLGLLPQPSADIVLVEIDEASINEFGRWPWSRGLFSRLLATLGDASVVVLDIVFSENSNITDDHLLKLQLEKQGNVILGFFMRQFASQIQSLNMLDEIEDCAYQDIELVGARVAVREYPYIESNILDFTRASLSCAVFSTEPDSDGIFRRYPLGYLFSGNLFPPLAIQSLTYSQNNEAQVVLDKQGIKSFRFLGNHIQNQNYIKLNYFSKIHSISAKALLNNTNIIDLSGKTVLIGLTDLGIYDMRPTPMDPVTPGVYLHYTAANNLLLNNIVKEFVWLDLFLYFLICVSVLFTSRLTSLPKKLFLYSSIPTLMFILSNLTFITFDVWLRESYGYLLYFLLVAFLETINFIYTSKDATKMREAFSSYVSPELVKRIGEDASHLNLGGDEKEITVLFADLRGFTKISEGLSPTELVALLNQIFEPLTQAVIHHDGMLDKYMGDALMAIFNAPLDIENHQEKAVKSLMDMQLAIHKINLNRQQNNLPNIKLGIGVNSGLAVVGNIGSSIRFSYTALGDAVNVASRLESLSKFYQCPYLISGDVFDVLPESLAKQLRFIDAIYVLGREQITRLYSGVGQLSEPELNTYQQAHGLYKKGGFINAQKMWRSIANADPISQAMVGRCDVLIKKPVSDWQGNFKFDHK